MVWKYLGQHCNETRIQLDAANPPSTTLLSYAFDVQNTVGNLENTNPALDSTTLFLDVSVGWVNVEF